MARWVAFQTYLDLYPRRIRRALGIGWLVSMGLAAIDFLSLLLLLPVFGVLATGGGTSTVLLGPAGDLADYLGTRSLLVLAMGLLMFRSVAGFAYRVWWTGRVADAEVGLSSRLLAGYAYAPYAFHLRRNSADLLSRAVAHVNVATGSGLNGFVALVADVTTVAALGGALFVASPVAGATVSAYLAIVGAAFVVTSRRYVASQTQEYSAEVALVYRRATTVLRGIRELTVAGARQAVLTSIDASRRRMVRAQRHMLLLNEVPRLVLDIALYSGILLALLFVLGGSHKSAIPLVALYVMAGLRMVPAIGRALGSLTLARTGLAIGLQVSTELASVQQGERTARSPSRTLPRHSELSLNHVTFSYDDELVVLDDVNLLVPFGMHLAVIGLSGSGKSTLLGLMLGLLRPNAGTVTYGGESIGLADPDWLRHVAYVPQEVFVLDDSLLANVALGHAKPDPERAWFALERAALTSVVRVMPLGLATPLGEAGSRLSVGQRQRLGIARALYRDPAILILDEPTAALDHENEAKIMETINGLGGTLSLIVVAHRLETIAAADRIVRMHGGRIEDVDPRRSHDHIPTQART